MRFADPIWFLLLLLMPLLAWWRGKKGVSTAVEYPSADLVREAAKARPFQAGRFLTTLRFLGLTLLIVGMARLQWGHGRTEVEASGIDIVLALDLSGSMASLDLKLGGKPASRLEVVQSVTEKFIEARPNDRIGLVAFAGRPYLVSPLTLDHEWLLANLERLKLGMIEDGTAIGSALATSVNRLREHKSKSKIVILLTDGMNNAGKVVPQTAADVAKTLGIKVYTIGVGVRGEAPMPVQDPFGNKHLQMIKVDVDEETLQKVAEVTGGQFYRATDTDSLKKVYAQIDRLEKTVSTLKKFQTYEEKAAWFMIPGIMVVLLEMILSQTLFRRLP